MWLALFILLVLFGLIPNLTKSEIPGIRALRVAICGMRCVVLNYDRLEI